MQPHEIKPDTKLCTIIGYNAQTGQARAYFNKILNHYGINATAIALNIKDEHFDFTMRNVATSKVDKMMIEKEFQKEALQYCNSLNDDANRNQKIDFIEVDRGVIEGFLLDEQAKMLFEDLRFVDEKALFVAKMMLVANRWYGVPIDLDLIPILIL